MGSGVVSPRNQSPTTAPVADRVGLGWWVGFEGGTFLGWWDLGRSDSTVDAPVSSDQAEIGWRVMSRQWRRGLATEGALLLLDHGFRTLGLQRIWAETMAVNYPSRGVMTKIGMHHVRTHVREWQDPLPGADEGEVLYEITATQWRQQIGNRPAFDAVRGS
ncbi:GNAT family N-acetyltransferase [Rhodococcus sp. KRD162]|uniref:GNAT family N-acetyltransferase n=1 Tax=Rhodococcus sp. KRD162 TaxID=2729725 RepID=UPI0019CF5D7A|nr:GNAT family protein [Rhodococcus sp. KRD162]